MTMAPITVAPAPNRRVRLQDGRVLTKPTKLPWTLYLQRLLDCGDVVKEQASATEQNAPAVAPSAPFPGAEEKAVPAAEPKVVAPFPGAREGATT